jgi:hypothetical protein
MNTVRWFKRQAKQLLKAHRAGDESVNKRIRDRTKNMTHIHLQKVQHVVAKEAGFADWKDLIDASDERRLSAIEVVRDDRTEARRAS